MCGKGVRPVGRYRVFLVGVMVFAGIIAAAFLFSRPSAILPDVQPYLRGAITRIDGQRLLVEEAPGQPTGNKCWFAVTDETLLVRGSERATPADLTVGAKVRAWARGPVLESFPCQTGAEAIALD